MATVSTISRRHFLRADLSARTTPLRPPWAVGEGRFLDACTRCGKCVVACGPGILKSDPRGYPVADFSRGECTFCAACLGACETGALLRAEPHAAPWTFKAAIEPCCLAEQGVMCSICREQCQYEAISLKPGTGGVPLPHLDASACTGCGACVAPCPTASIHIVAPRREITSQEAVCT